MWLRTVLMDCHWTIDLEGHLGLCLVKSQLEFLVKSSPVDGTISAILEMPPFWKAS